MAAVYLCEANQPIVRQLIREISLIPRRKSLSPSLSLSLSAALEFPRLLLPEASSIFM